MRLRFEAVTYLHRPATRPQRSRVTPARDHPVAGVRHIDLELGPGRVNVIVGPNGAGKSTLVRVATGRLRPTSGRVLVDERPVEALGPRERAAAIGYVPADPRVDHGFSVEEVVGMGRYRHVGALAAPSMDDRERVDDALTHMDLQHVRTRPVTSLSGGERQRVALARVLAQDPQVVLLDEATANLDIGQAWRTESWAQATAGAGRNVIMVLHDLSAAARVADHVVLMDAGAVVAEGAPKDVLTDERLSRTYGTGIEVIEVGDELVFRRAR